VVHRFIVFIVLAFMGVSLSHAPAAAQGQAFTWLFDTVVRLKNVQTGKCVYIDPNTSPFPSARLRNTQISPTCDPQDPTLRFRASNSNGRFILRHIGTDLCLQVLIGSGNPPPVVGMQCSMTDPGFRLIDVTTWQPTYLIPGVLQVCQEYFGPGPYRLYCLKNYGTSIISYYSPYGSVIPNVAKFKFELVQF
jgi:hypothetical protein